MGEIPAHAPAFGMGVPCRLGRACMLIAELDAIVNVIADRLHQMPTSANISELRPCDIDEAVGLAISAAEEENERVHRQVRERMLLCVRRHLIRLAVVSHHEVRGHAHATSRSMDDMAEIAENVMGGIGWGGRSVCA